MLRHRLSALVIGIQGIRSLEITLPECWHGESLSTRFIDDSVNCTLVLASSPLLHHVTQVDHVLILDGWNEEPLLGGGVPHFEAMLPWILQ